MNKILLLGAAAFGLYLYFGKPADEGEALELDPATGADPIELTDAQASQYLANYADLSTAFGRDLEKAKWHWRVIGHTENRTYEQLVRRSAGII
ncbi:MAG TPA: hypothetical protein VF581_07675 [Flavobacterium sp.]|jgi:hypothetical protein